MQIVAINKVTGTATDLGKELANVLGVTAYEARLRINAANGGPVVIANFATLALATKCTDSLAVAGFDPICIDSDNLENGQNRFVVQQLNFNVDALQLIDQGGELLKINYADINLLLRGSEILNNVQSETVTKKKFAAGRALATGGLMMRKKVTSTATTVDSTRQPFCHIYATDLPVIVLRQSTIDFAAIGSACKLSSTENFSYICSELRNRCVNSSWDERLQTRPGIKQLLGPIFNPEQDLDLAITIIVKSYQASKLLTMS